MPVRVAGATTTVFGGHYARVESANELRIRRSGGRASETLAATDITVRDLTAAADIQPTSIDDSEDGLGWDVQFESSPLEANAHSLLIRNKSWARTDAITLPWDGTAGPDTDHRLSYLLPGDNAPSGWWLGVGETPARLAAVTGAGVSRADTAATGGTTTVAANRLLNIQGLFTDEWERYVAAHASSSRIVTSAACAWRSGRNRLGRRIGGWTMDGFGPTSVVFAHDGHYLFYGCRYLKGNDADMQQSASQGAFGSSNNLSDVDITFAATENLPLDRGAAGGRVRFSDLAAPPEPRRLDITMVGITAIRQGATFSPSSYRPYGGGQLRLDSTGTQVGLLDRDGNIVPASLMGAGEEYEGVQVSQPSAFVTYHNFEAGLGPQGQVYIAGSTPYGAEFVNPRFPLDRLAWRTLHATNRDRTSRARFAIGVFTDLAVSLVHDASLATDGILAYTHTTFRRTALGNFVGGRTWVDEPTTSYGTVRGDLDVIRVPVFFWDVNGQASPTTGESPPTTFADRSRLTQRLRVRRADINFIERDVTIDTTIGPNETAVEVSKDPAFTGTVAEAAALDYDGAVRRFTVSSATINGTLVHTIAVHRNATLQQLYRWLKWEYSRGTLPAAGSVPERADRRLEDLPVSADGSRLTFARDWVLTLDGATLSPDSSIDTLSLSSQHDFLGAAEWDTAAFYTPGQLVKVTGTTRTRWWVCTTNAGPGQQPTRTPSGDPALVRWREVTDLGTVVFRNGGSLADGLRYIDAHGRSISINTEPGATVAHVATEQRTRLVAVVQDETSLAVNQPFTLRHYALDGTRHAEEDIEITNTGGLGTVRLGNGPGGIAYLRDHNDWAVGRGELAPGRGSYGGDIIFRHDSVGHLLASNTIPGMWGVNGLAYIDADRLAFVGQSTSGTPHVGIISIADIDRASAPRGISGGLRTTIPGTTSTSVPGSQGVTAGVAWGANRLWVVINEYVGGGFNARISVVAVEVTETGLSIDWSRSFKVANAHASPTYYQYSDGITHIGGRLYVSTRGGSLRQAIAYTPPDGTSGPADLAALMAAPPRAGVAASTIRLSEAGNEVLGFTDEVRDVATGSVTVGTAGDDGSYSFTVGAAQTRPIALIAKKYGFHMRGVKVQPTDTAHALSLSENQGVPRNVDISDYDLTERTAADRPRRNIYLELNDPATSRQSVLRFADTYDIRSNPDKFRAILDTILSSSTGAQFYLRFFLNPSSHNNGRVVDIEPGFVDILEPYLRFARKAGLADTARPWAGITVYTGDGTTEYEPPVENGGRVSIPPPRILVIPSFANSVELAQQVFADPAVQDGLATEVVQPTADAVARNRYFETPFRLRTLTGVGHAAVAAGILSGDSQSVTLAAGGLVVIVFDLLDDTGARTSIPSHQLPGIQGTVSASREANWRFRVWTSSAQPSPLSTPTGTPVMDVDGEGGAVARTAIRGDVGYGFMRIENDGADPVTITVTGFRISSRLAFSPTSVHVSEVVDETREIARTASVTDNGVGGATGTDAFMHMGTADSPKTITARSVAGESRGSMRVTWNAVPSRGNSGMALEMRTMLGTEEREEVVTVSSPARGQPLASGGANFEPTRDFDRIRVRFTVSGTNLDHTVSASASIKYNIRELADDYVDSDIPTLPARTVSQVVPVNAHSNSIGKRVQDIDTIVTGGFERVTPRTTPDTYSVRGGGGATAEDILAATPQAGTAQNEGTVGRLIADGMAKAKKLKFPGVATGEEAVEADIPAETFRSRVRNALADMDVRASLVSAIQESTVTEALRKAVLQAPRTALVDTAEYASGTLGSLLGRLLVFTPQGQWNIRFNAHDTVGPVADMAHGVWNFLTTSQYFMQGDTRMGRIVQAIKAKTDQIRLAGTADVNNERPVAVDAGTITADVSAVTLAADEEDKIAKAVSQYVAPDDDADPDNSIGKRIGEIKTSVDALPSETADVSGLATAASLTSVGNDVASVKAITDRIDFTAMGSGKAPIKSVEQSPLTQRGEPPTTSEIVQAIKDDSDLGTAGLVADAQTAAAQATLARKGIINTVRRSGTASTMEIIDDDGNVLETYDLTDVDGSPARTDVAYNRTRRTA